MAEGVEGVRTLLTSQLSDGLQSTQDKVAQKEASWLGSLHKKQYELIVGHRLLDGKSTDDFKEFYAHNPMKTTEAQGLVNETMAHKLEKVRHEHLLQPFVQDGKVDPELNAIKQYESIIEYKELNKQSTSTIKAQFAEILLNP